MTRETETYSGSSFMQTLDHITYRMTASTTTGVIVGASYSTLRGLPLPQTTISMASSFALASTACFIPERVFYHASFYLVPEIKPGAPEHDDVNAGKIGDGNSIQRIESNFEGLGSYITENSRLVFSHGLGGILGGSISGGLFKGRPSQGIMLLTPMMLGVAYGELKLQEYKLERIKELQQELQKR